MRTKHSKVRTYAFLHWCIKSEKKTQKTRTALSHRAHVAAASNRNPAVHTIGAWLTKLPGVALGSVPVVAAVARLALGGAEHVATTAPVPDAVVKCCKGARCMCVCVCVVLWVLCERDVV